LKFLFLLVEGKKKTAKRNVYERDSKIKRATIKIHGLRCMVCGFDFEEFYGLLGHGHIIAHHLTPVSEFEGLRKVDPETDMAVVCSNCHSMIHQDKGYTIPLDVLKAIVEKQRAI